MLAGRLILPGRGFTPASGYQLLSPGNGPATAIMGVGIGPAFSAMSALVVAAVPADQTGVASG